VRRDATPSARCHARQQVCAVAPRRTGRPTGVARLTVRGTAHGSRLPRARAASFMRRRRRRTRDAQLRWGASPSPTEAPPLYGDGQHRRSTGLCGGGALHEVHVQKQQAGEHALPGTITSPPSHEASASEGLQAYQRYTTLAALLRDGGWLPTRLPHTAATTNRRILWCSGSMRVSLHVSVWRASAVLRIMRRGQRIPRL
jgi:hypothetical protein